MVWGESAATCVNLPCPICSDNRRDEMLHHALVKLVKHIRDYRPVDMDVGQVLPKRLHDRFQSVLVIGGEGGIGVADEIEHDRDVAEALRRCNIAKICFVDRTLRAITC